LDAKRAVVQRAKLWPLILGLLFAACTFHRAPTRSGAGTPRQAPIVIGVLADLTGQGAIEAAEIHLNVDLAVAQINAAGGIGGRTLQAVYADPRGDPALARKLARQQVDQQGASVLLGGVLSAECLALTQSAVDLGGVYLTASGCPTAEVTAEYCNKNSFRVLPAGPQLIAPLASYAVSTYGRRWAILYPDYAFGQAQMQAYDAAFTSAGASLPLRIGIPLGDQDPATYVSRIPTDGSIDGLINAETGADLAAVDGVLTEAGVSSRMPVVFSGSKEQFAGSYPDAVNGFLTATPHASSPVDPGDDERAYAAAFGEAVNRQPQMAALLGGPSKAVPGALGYQTYATMSALRLAMEAANFTGRPDTARLIQALESLSVTGGPDFPAGAMQMNRPDHQGSATVQIVRVSGQREEVLQTVPPENIPRIGRCQV
jgi:branched-chain amino acid transport system substrate-binding protein